MFFLIYAPFTEMEEASNSTTPLTSSNYGINRIYEKILTTFNTPYLYISFTF